MWDAAATGTPLASASGDNSTSLSPSVAYNASIPPGSYLFTPISSVTLSPGHTYVLAAYYPTGGAQFISNPSVQTVSGVHYVGNRYLNASGVAYPSSSIGSNVGFVGPNISFAIQVPEPQEYGVAVGMVLMGFAIWARRSRSASLIVD